MKKMKPVTTLLPLLLLCLTLPLLCQGTGPQEDDLVFDDVGEETPTAVSAEAESSPSPSSPTSTHSHSGGSKKWQRVEKLLGMPDAVASVGHVFKLHVPKQAFAGDVDFYEARGSSGKGLPHWLRWDEPASALYGVPSRKDVGRHRVTIKAFGKKDDVALDAFYVHVVPEKREHYKHKDGKRCTEEQDRTMLTILIDARYENLKPSAKVNALENLAGFLGLHTSSVSIQPELGSSGRDSYGPSTSIVLSGPGNVGRRREKHSTVVQWQVGCDGHFWPHQINMIKLIPEQARDGTLSEVMELPVYQWRVRSESTDYARNRRDTAGSGDDLLPDEEDEDYEEEYDDEDDYPEGITESPQEPKQKPVIHPAGGSGIVDEHPHRHHHGEDNIAGIGAGVNSEEDFIWRNAEINNSIFNTTATTTTTASPTTIAVTLPPSTTTPPTTTSTTTTTTTTPEPPTEPSSTTTESTTSSTFSMPTEPSLPSEVTEGTTSTSTAPTVSSGTVDTVAENTTNPLTFTNLTQVATNTQGGGNVTTDSLTVDNEEPLPTERDIDNETDADLTTTLQPSVFAASESTTSAGLSTPASNVGGGGGAVEAVGTAEPNATSIFTVNATGDEYTEASVPSREASPGSSSTFTTSPWGDNVTERVSNEPLDPYDTMHVPVFSSPTTTTESTTTTTTTPSTPSPTTSTTTTTTTPEPTTPSTTPTTTTTTTTTPEPTTPSTTPSTTTPTTTTTTTTTTFTPPIITNLAPKIERRLQKLPITQGKLLSFRIPEETFHDPEDGDTKNLRLRIYEKGAPLKPSHWLQFNEETQEVYGLPLEQYGMYTFEVVATDSKGLTASDKLEISVMQHKQSRAVNHEFHIYLKIEKWSKFPTNVDWELKVMRSLAELYGDSDLQYITVRSIDITDDQAIYSWTNDSLIRSNYCPQEEINKLYRVLVSDEKTEVPSDALINVLGREIKPKRVVYQGLEQCQQTKETQVNKYPILRNQIDQVNATVGQLFVYRVPKDTFFDEEDGDTRSMKASLLTGNRTEIPPWDWLQFDSSNQEFYGVPLKQDVGSKPYQLIVKDREGLEATDSLVAQVAPAPVMRHVVEISMTLDMPMETFAHSAQKKREFIQKLQKLYGDRNASAISLLSISGNRVTTTVTWRNLTLPTYECPHEQITRLRSVLVNDNKSFTEELTREFNSDSQQREFTVTQITVSQMGACQDVGIGGPEMPPIDDSTSVGASHDDYLITFVLPAIIIAAMLILAGIIACILYKRKRSGKMSVSEKDDERQSFRSKGIPVIFQDELDEKPDPGNKSPIILKEEKPPLPPPEYQRAEDGADIPMLSKENSEEPYQPPPPFATNRDSNRQNRPKPTPTYRKPPPYVPP